MKDGLLLTVIATVMAVDGGQAKLDRGLLDGLLWEDRGEVFYELRVGESAHHIVEGVVEVVELDRYESVVALPTGTRARPGYTVRFEVSAERIAPRALVAAARELAADEAEFREIVQEILADSIVADDPTVRSELRRLIGEEVPETEPAAAPSWSDGMVLVAGGVYRIGADLGEARFFNEHPRFDEEVEPFWVDREALAPEALNRPSFAEAFAFCRERGKRLPTEVEWEVAIQVPGVEAAPFLEWTDSWYEPYPGNPMAEREYGRGYRVLRGERGSGELRPQRRRYMDPDRGHSQVGFRCARDLSPNDL